MDSVNKTNHRRDTILERTNWPKSFFKDKLILECGCGAGPDTEVLLSLGARVISVDIAGLDFAKKNIGPNANSQLLQASLLDLPLKENSFDIVFCHRVIQHTPNPELVLEEILKYVKPKGDVFVHSYARTLFQMLRWKYFLRPITKRMNPVLLYKLIKFYSPFLFRVTSFFRKFGKIGSAVNHFLIPFLNYRHQKVFKNKSNDWIIEYGIHDTFDALSPKYDSPISSRSFNKTSNDLLKSKKIEFELIKDRSITYLRSIR